MLRVGLLVITILLQLSNVSAASGLPSGSATKGAGTVDLTRSDAVDLAVATGPASAPQAGRRASVSLRSRGLLRVDVGPDRRGWRDVAFSLDRRRDGRWQLVGTYRTRGSREVRRLALAPGRYRARVSAYGPVSGGVSSPIRHAPPPATGDAERVLQLVNQVRQTPTRCGGQRYPAVGRVGSDPRLARAALRHAQDMRRVSSMTHSSPRRSPYYPAGAGPAKRALQEGYTSSYVGENVAFGYPTADAVTRAWVRSEGHCVNIMRRGFDEVGVGHSGIYWALVLGAR